MSRMFKNTSSIFLVLTVLSFSFSAGIIYNFDKIYAQGSSITDGTTNPVNDEISLSLPKACTFASGDDPITDPDTCTPIQSNQNAGSDDSILFNLDSTEAVNTFTCELLDQNGNIAVLPAGNPENPGDCKISGNRVQIQYTDLEDSRYTFIVRATVKEDITENNNGNNVVTTVTRTGESPPFVFIIGTGAGLSGGAGFQDRSGAEAVPPNIATLANTKAASTGVIPKLNPVWQTCTATNQGQQVQNGLSAMKYSAYGVASFRDFDSELKKYNTNDFTLEIFVDFLSGEMVADLYPTPKDIDKLRSTKDLYRLDPYIYTEEQVSSKGPKDTPNRFPFGIKAVDTECVYKGPLAVSLSSGGSNVFVNADIFRNGNPPFQTCTDSDAATYTITFAIDADDRGKLDEGIHNVRMTITQFLAGNAPSYYGSLVFDPYEDDEKRIKLDLNARNIVTECRSSVVFDNPPN